MIKLHLYSLYLFIIIFLFFFLTISFSYFQFIRECEARLVVDQMTYLQAYVPEMVQAERLSDLSNLFTLFSGIPKALEPVKKEFRAKVRQEGNNLVNNVRNRILEFEIHPNENTTDIWLFDM